ncbi:7782_t:CDS:1, partial [Acaulospora morrowiae]
HSVQDTNSLYKYGHKAYDLAYLTIMYSCFNALYLNCKELSHRILVLIRGSRNKIPMIITGRMD